MHYSKKFTTWLLLPQLDCRWENSVHAQEAFDKTMQVSCSFQIKIKYKFCFAKGAINGIFVRLKQKQVFRWKVSEASLQQKLLIIIFLIKKKLYLKASISKSKGLCGVLWNDFNRKQKIYINSFVSLISFTWEIRNVNRYHH